MWSEHELLEGTLQHGLAKITSCGISGPAGLLQQEAIKNIHMELFSSSSRGQEGRVVASGFGLK